jgi:hypothetical protein
VRSDSLRQHDDSVLACGLREGFESLPSLPEGVGKERATFVGQKIEDDQPRRKLAAAGWSRSCSASKGWPGMTSSPVDNEAIGFQPREAGGNFREKAVERFLLPGLEVYLVAVAKSETAEAVILGLEQPAFAAREIIDRFGLHRLQREGDWVDRTPPHSLRQAKPKINPNPKPSAVVAMGRSLSESSTGFTMLSAMLMTVARRSLPMSDATFRKSARRRLMRFLASSSARTARHQMHGVQIIAGPSQQAPLPRERLRPRSVKSGRRQRSSTCRWKDVLRGTMDEGEFADQAVPIASQRSGRIRDCSTSFL